MTEISEQTGMEYGSVVRQVALAHQEGLSEIAFVKYTPTKEEQNAKSLSD